MKDKIRKIPISYHTRLKNQLGKGSVPCKVSDRWLKFPSDSSIFDDGEYIIMDVMTTKDDKHRKICELIITKEDIIEAINRIKPKKNAQQ